MGRARSCISPLRSLLAAGLLALVLAAPAAASGADRGPELSVPRSELEAAFHCPRDPASGRGAPIMLVTGTASTGAESYAMLAPAFAAYGHPVCFVDFPDFTTADIQTSVQYLVHGIRAEHRLGGRKVALYGISQGALLSRFALTYWPDLRGKVRDLVAVAGTLHGTDLDLADCSEGCAPAVWQQLAGSKLLGALNSQPDETPGGVSYTTVRTRMDEIVQPQSGKHPTSSLEGARNILIQDVCPGRVTGHLGAIVNSVSFGALVDAVGDKGRGMEGAAKPSRLPAALCDQPYADGLVQAQIDALIAAAAGVLAGRLASVPAVASEPQVRKVFRRTAG